MNISKKEELLENFEEFREQIISIIKNYDIYKKIPIYNSDENGFTLAIDSRWGTGKTTFLKRLEEKINNSKELYAIYYNSWENDDFDNAIVPIIYNLNILLNKIYKMYGNNNNNTFLENTKNFLSNLRYPLGKININIPVMGVEIGANTGELVKSIKDAFNNNPRWIEDDIFGEYKRYQEIKESFREVLKRTFPLDKSKMVIIIDELDRCRPIFAIETLEAIKHFFDLNNIIFIFAIDVEQLSHSIATMYGSNMDASGYLRRFFDLQISFPPIKINDFIKIQFLKEDGILQNKETLEGLIYISENLNLSLREIEKFTSHLNLIYKLNIKNKGFSTESKVSAVFIYYYLIIITCKYEGLWKDICDKKFSFGNIDRFKTEYNNKLFHLPAKYIFEDNIEPRVVRTFCRDILISKRFFENPRSEELKSLEINITDLAISNGDSGLPLMDLINRNLSLVQKII